MDLKYVSYKNKVPEDFAELNCNPFNLDIPISKNWKSSKNRLLVILEHVDRDDLESRAVLGDKKNLELAFKILTRAKKYASNFETIDDYEIAFINFNNFKNYHLESDAWKNSIEWFTKRVKSYITTIVPTHILICGDVAAKNLLHSDYVAIEHGQIKTLEIENTKYKVVTTLDYNRIFKRSSRSRGNAGVKASLDTCNLFNYVITTAASIFLKKHPFSLAKIKPKPVLVDTIKKFDKLYNKLLKSDHPIAVDTETEDLSVVTNTLLTIQFAISSKKGYIVPIYHPQSPFSKDELSYIITKLQYLFSRKEKDRYLIMQNGIFDINVIKSAFKVPFIRWKIWDTIAGEFCLDENVSRLDKAVVSSIYFHPFSLGRIFSSYDNNYYWKASFSKGDRKNIKDTDLNEILDYASMDVQSIYAIHIQQQKKAKYIDFNGVPYLSMYQKFMLHQMSSIVHVQAAMKQRGFPIDKKYLMKMVSKVDSPLKLHIYDLKKKLYKKKSVRAANKLLLAKSGSPSKGLFGEVKKWVFDIDKSLHKQVLYISVLGLDPVKYGKSETPSLDKAFQKKHSGIKEVKILSKMNGLNILYNNFCAGTYKKAVSDKDFLYDGTLRPNYFFDYVLTGRSNSKNPNLQQVPQHSKYAKSIKRMFIAPKGGLFIKYDFSAHEVRGWGNVSYDTSMASAIKEMVKVILQYRANPTEENKKIMKLRSDIHKINYNAFTGVRIEDITDEQRQHAKNIVFGSIYGMTVATLAKNIKLELDEAKKIMANFFAKFKQAKKWLDNMKKFSKKHLYAFSPIGRRRNLSGYLLDDPLVSMFLEKRATNSPIQGFGSDLGYQANRLIEEELFYVSKKKGQITNDMHMMPNGVMTMIHDSGIFWVSYENLLAAMRIIEYMTTTGLALYLEKEYGFKLTVNLSIEFEVGGSWDSVQKWDWSPAELKRVIKEGLIFQRDQLKQKILVNKTLKKIYKEEQKDHDWLVQRYPLAIDEVEKNAT